MLTHFITEILHICLICMKQKLHFYHLEIKGDMIKDFSEFPAEF